MAQTLRSFGQGMKAAFECAVMALDTDAIPYRVADDDSQDDEHGVENKELVGISYSNLKKKNQTPAVTKVIKFTKKGKGTMKYTLISAKEGKRSFKKYFKVKITENSRDQSLP